MESGLIIKFVTMNNVKEMIATVQMYIHHRKNIEVKIDIRNTRDLFLLTQAYNTVIEWMNENNFVVIR